MHKPLSRQLQKTHTVILVAGTSEPSNCEYLADRFIEGIESGSGTWTTKIRLKDVELRHFSLSDYEANAGDDDLQKIRDLIVGADAVVIASPTWNFSVPAHLKNLIDRMGAFALDAETRSLGTLNGKPFYLILTGGTPAAGWPLMKRTTSHLPMSIQYFGGSIIGTHFEPRCTKGPGVFGLVVDQRPGSLTMMREKGKAFVKLVEKYHRTGKLPLKHRLMQNFVRCAQRVKKRLGI